MNMREILEGKLSGYTGFDGSQVVFREAPLGSVNLEKLATTFLNAGRLIEQDENTGITVGVISAGAACLNEAILAVSCHDDRLHICASAREGIVSQKTAEQAVDKLLDALAMEGSSTVTKTRQRRWLAPVLVMTIVLALCIAAIMLINPAAKLTKDYNEAVRTFNDLSTQYNERMASVSVANVEGFPEDLGSLTSVDESWLAVALSLSKGNSCEKIASDIQTIEAASDAVRYDLKIIGAIDNPSDDYVGRALDRVVGISAIESVSSGNDPNEMLGKKGGYSSCVYFALTSLADQKQDAGPVATGVDAGGAVEVFPTLADAEARCDYLAKFDDSILESGSYALVGTMVVRTSRLLDEDEQLQLTNEIVAALTDIEG